MTLLVGKDTGTTGTEDLGGGGTVIHNCTIPASVYIGQAASVTGTATSILIKWRSTQGAGRKLQCAIWSSGSATPTLLAQTTEYTTTGSEVAGTFATLPLVSSISITAGTAYILSAWSNNFINVFCADSGAGRRFKSATYVSNDWTTGNFSGSGSAGATEIVMYADGTPASTTITPAPATLTLAGKTGSTNVFASVAIKEVLINEAGSPVSNRTGMSLLVWYGGSPAGIPDLSYSALTTDANGTASWSIAPGTLVYNQPVFYVATDGGASLSMYTCARMVPTYS